MENQKVKRLAMENSAHPKMLYEMEKETKLMNVIYLMIVNK